MNKKLLATAIGVALAGAVSSASAAVKVYGYINGSYDFYNNSSTHYKCDNPTGPNGCMDKSGSGFSSNSTNFGLKGSEDIGGGNAFIWQFESNIDLNGSGQTLGTRNTFAGFRGGWGTVFAGKHDSAMKMADTKVMPFNNTVGDSRNIMGSGYNTIGPGSNGKQENILNQRFGRVLAYVSPNMMGFNGYLIYVGGSSTASNESANTKAGGYDLAASYNNGPIKGWLAYEKQFSDVSNSDIKAWRVSGSYNMNPFKVGAIYENITVDSGNSHYLSADRNAWGLFGMMKMGMNDIGLAYYKADNTSVASSGADMWVLGAYHHFTKQTNVYAMYASMSNDNNASYALGGGGHGDLIPPTQAGADPSVFSVGFEHKF